MIKFFRKIRQNLISENKFSKYLIYAIGEIALVMIGILLALQVSNWNKQHNDRKEEKQILIQLRSEFLQNLAQLNDKFLLRENILTNGETILNLIDNPKPNINSDSLNRLLSKTLTAPTFEASLGVTNEILNSGKLYLIKNDELRHNISGLRGDIDFATEVEVMWKDLRDNFYIPFLTESIQLRNIYNELLSDSGILNIMTSKNTNSAASMGKSRKGINIETFLIDSELEDYISNMLAINYVAKIQMTGLYNNMETILELINSELDNK
ncbi:MAG: hypothetical protein KJN66_10545 [Bacteroidia bacterium]|nr:hypothetical protein [Bacteroidia bacterium]